MAVLVIIGFVAVASTHRCSIMRHCGRLSAISGTVPPEPGAVLNGGPKDSAKHAWEGRHGAVKGAENIRDGLTWPHGQGPHSRMALHAGIRRGQGDDP